MSIGSSSEEIIRTMRAVLEEERTAIRKLDSETVNRTTAQKEALLVQLRDATTGASANAVVLGALKELKADLRYNLVLLAHARDTLKEVVESSAVRRPRIDAKL